MFDIRISNLNAGSYLCTTPEKDPEKEEKENKDIYLQYCLEHRCTFTPMFYSEDVIPGVGALVSQKRIAALFSFKLKWK